MGTPGRYPRTERDSSFRNRGARGPGEPTMGDPATYETRSGDGTLRQISRRVCRRIPEAARGSQAFSGEKDDI